MTNYMDWMRNATDEQLERVLLGGAHPGSPNHDAAKYILDKRRREREAAMSTVSPQPPAQPRLVVDFSFLRASALRRIAERDWDECQRAFNSGCWKSVLILAGGIVETVLLALLGQRKSRALKASAAAGVGTDLTRWTLDRMIKVAAELKVVPPAAETLPNPLRQYRNLAHPGNEVREKLEFGEPDAATAFNALRSILTRLSKARVEAHPSAATASKLSTLSATERPYISVSAIGLQPPRLAPGPPLVRWTIENSGQTPATIVEANMTIWFATNEVPLPAKPQYKATPHTLSRVVVAPQGGVFEAKFQCERVLSSEDVKHIEQGNSKMYVFGFVKYRDLQGAERTKGFIALYKPRNDPASGMFDYVEGSAYNYGD